MIKQMTGADVLAVAAREIGYREIAGKINKYGAWYRMNGVPWCMQFVQWCYYQAGAMLPHKTASCGDMLSWYRHNQPDCISKAPVKGCIVIFDFPKTVYSTDHTGLFVKTEGQTITTIDGNTSGGNDANGGWVQQRTRKLSYANPIYIIPREITEQEDNVMRLNTMDEIVKSAPWAVDTVKKLQAKGVLNGNGAGLDLSLDMLRLLVFNDRAGLYGGAE
jgi:hypothetical protein